MFIYNRFAIPLLLTAALISAAFVTPRAASAHRPGAGSGTLTAAFHDEFDTLDPAIGYNPFAWTGEHAIFNGLLGYANLPGKRGTQLVPDLATSLPSISHGGRIYTFRLRSDVRFAPPVNRAVTASDVRFSIERALAKRTAGPMYQSSFFSPLSGSAAFWAGKAAHIRGIHVLGPSTIQFRLDTPDIAFQDILALPFAAVVPYEVTARWGKKFSHHVVGTGPYRLQTWSHSHMTLVANPNYFRPGLPRVPHVSIQFGVDEHLQILRAERNQLDLPGNLVTSTDYLALRRGPYARQLAAIPDIGVWYLAMNTKMTPFAGNLRLRRAFNEAINKRYLLRLVNGRGVVMNGILPPTMPGANPRFSMYRYNPAGARTDLKAAGYGPGQLKLSMLYISAPDQDRVADRIASDLAAIGVTITLKPVSADTAYSTVYTPGKSALTLFHWGQDYPDPSDFVDPILTCGASSNAAFYCNARVDQLANRARADTNRAHRFATYRQIERSIMADAPWVPLYADQLYDFHSARVKNFFIHPVWPFVYDQYRL